MADKTKNVDAKPVQSWRKLPMKLYLKLPSEDIQGYRERQQVLLDSKKMDFEIGSGLAGVIDREEEGARQERAAELRRRT
jgi:hypothetical protein